MLSSTVDEEGNIDEVIKRFIKKLNGSIAVNFQKKTINKKVLSNKNKDLYDKMRELKFKDDVASKEELDEVVKAIATAENDNFMKLVDELSKLKSGYHKVDSKQLWKLKRRLCPRVRDAPCAMNDAEGNLVTSDRALQKRAQEVFSQRLQGNKIEPHLEELQNDVNTLCELRVKISESNKSEKWTMEDLKTVLKQLDNDKSRDPEGHANELFKEGVAGEDLLDAILKIMNMMKNQLKYPKVLEKCNITPIYKKKSKRDFENYRGVFRVGILRSILDRLTYNDSYYTIDSNLTDGNVGGRKSRSVRDNIFVISAVINFVTNGNSEAIQVQVMDAEKCFDKLWLQSCINALHEAGITNDHLKLLYIENKNGQIAVKINNKISSRILVRNLVMQGSVWGSLKCTTTMDKLNKIALSDESLQYRYKGDPNIPIGVLGMVDDTLGVSKCGQEAIRKNAVINSFMETQRLTLSKEKSVVLHYGKESKCALPCPTLKVHKDDMLKQVSTKYLGNILSTSGNMNENVEDRRNKGWGKISLIMGILSEVDMGVHQLEAGLRLREAILISSLLYSAEAWSGVTDRHMSRLEVVDSALLKRLTGSHSKCPSEFHHLETGTWKLRHHLTYLRLMYHHQILTREDSETVKKIYLKQKEEYVKGDWYQLLKGDFQFIGQDINENEICSTPKSEYKIKIKSLINKAAFKYFQSVKETHSKLNDITYKKFQLQPYLSSQKLNNLNKELLYKLRSKCHESKMNFRKLHRNNLNCVFGCLSNEDQVHSFVNCLPIVSKISKNSTGHYRDIFGTLDKQICIMKTFENIQKMRIHTIKNHHLPGGATCQDPCTFGDTFNGAADTTSA